MRESHRGCGHEAVPIKQAEYMRADHFPSPSRTCKGRRVHTCWKDTITPLRATHTNYAESTTTRQGTMRSSGQAIGITVQGSFRPIRPMGFHATRQGALQLLQCEDGRAHDSSINDRIERQSARSTSSSGFQTTGKPPLSRRRRNVTNASTARGTCDEYGLSA